MKRQDIPARVVLARQRGPRHEADPVAVLDTSTLWRRRHELLAVGDQAGTWQDTYRPVAGWRCATVYTPTQQKDGWLAVELVYTEAADLDWDQRVAQLRDWAAAVPEHLDAEAVSLLAHDTPAGLGLTVVDSRDLRATWADYSAGREADRARQQARIRRRLDQAAQVRQVRAAMTARGLDATGVTESGHGVLVPLDTMRQLLGIDSEE